MEEKEVDYWSKKEEEVLAGLETSRNGLTHEEAEARLKKYGYNALKKKSKTLRIFLKQFKNPLIWILIVTTIISIAFGQLLNSIIILVMILFVSLISFFQEYRSEKTVEDLNKRISHTALVVRDAEKQEVDVKDLVPGDMVVLNLGDIVPADLRIIESKNLEINEAILTGESVPVEKRSQALKLKNPNIRDIGNYAFAGTTIASGEALGVVIATAENTQMGSISKQVSEERPETSFQKGIKNFSNMLVQIILILTVLIFAVNTLLRHDILSSLLFALAVAIGMTPELLPMVLTVGLSKGAKKMAKNDVIVKRLIAIEDFGNMDILCTDKTGTLTEGNILLHDHFDAENKTNDQVLVYGMVCNSAIVHNKKIIGNPMDAALWQHSSEKHKEEVKLYKKIDELPFDYDRKMMSVIAEYQKKNILITKGALRSVLKKCSRISINGRITNMPYYRKRLEKKFTELSNQGLRVIAVAYKETNPQAGYRISDENNLIFLGFITFIDPPKKTVKNALEKLEALDIKLKIFTGDNEIVTQHIAQEVGIPSEKIVLAEDIDKMDDYDLGKVVEKSNIFCRLTPKHKLRIIKALKENGHDVGYIGDGVNDVSALHEADVGISVNTAVDVAKDASDIIMLKKSLESLAAGVEEGRKIFGNTMKYIMIGTSSNFGNMLSVAIASAFLPFLPMLPVQILFMNLCYDVSQTAIPTDNVDPEYLKKPKVFDINSIKRFMLFFGPISTLWDIATFLILIFIFKAAPGMFRTGWFMESMATQLLIVFAIRTRKVPFWKSKPAKGVLFASILTALAALIIPFTILGHVFQFTAVPYLFFVLLAAMLIAYFALVELQKKWFFSRWEV